MATPKLTKVRRGVRARIIPSSESTAGTIPVKPIPEPVRQHLQMLVKTLRDIETSVLVAAAALRDEDSFIGVSVARILRIHVSNRLSVEIDQACALYGIELKPFKEDEP